MADKRFIGVLRDGTRQGSHRRNKGEFVRMATECLKTRDWCLPKTEGEHRYY